MDMGDYLAAKAFGWLIILPILAFIGACRFVWWLLKALALGVVSFVGWVRSR